MWWSPPGLHYNFEKFSKWLHPLKAWPRPTGLFRGLTPPKTTAPVRPWMHSKQNPGPILGDFLAHNWYSHSYPNSKCVQGLIHYFTPLYKCIFSGSIFRCWYAQTWLWTRSSTLRWNQFKFNHQKDWKLSDQTLHLQSQRWFKQDCFLTPTERDKYVGISSWSFVSTFVALLYCNILEINWKS